MGGDLVAGPGGKGCEEGRVEFFGGGHRAGLQGVDEGWGGGDQAVALRHLSGKGVVLEGPVIACERQDSRQPGGAGIHPGGEGEVRLQNRGHAGEFMGAARCGEGVCFGWGNTCVTVGKVLILLVDGCGGKRLLRGWGCFVEVFATTQKV